MDSIAGWRPGRTICARARARERNSGRVTWAASSQRRPPSRAGKYAKKSAADNQEDGKEGSVGRAAGRRLHRFAGLRSLSLK